MYLYLWVIFSLNILLSAGIMLTYLSRNDHKRDSFLSQISTSPQSRVLVIVPTRGVDFELDENLASLKNQDFSSFDLMAVVDSVEDLSVPYLKKEGIEYIESTASCTKCSGKVRAIYSAILRYPEYDSYVVADSDIRAERSWLANLVGPLYDPKVGVSTSFPIFYPAGGFWSKLKMFWGLAGQSMMESNLTKFVWGGSMAFRKELLDEESLKSFSQSISDDIAILRIVEAKGLKISYVPESRPKIYSTDDFRTFLEWSNRQTAFSIYSSNKTFLFGMVYYLASIYLLLSAIVFSVLVNDLFAVFLFVYFFNSFNSQRKVPVRVWYFLSLTFILPFVYVWNLMSGKFSKKVVWRGRVYPLSKSE